MERIQIVSCIFAFILTILSLSVQLLIAQMIISDYIIFIISAISYLFHKNNTNDTIRTNNRTKHEYFFINNEVSKFQILQLA